MSAAEAGPVTTTVVGRAVRPKKMPSAEYWNANPDWPTRATSGRIVAAWAERGALRVQVEIDTDADGGSFGAWLRALVVEPEARLAEKPPATMERLYDSVVILGDAERALRDVVEARRGQYMTWGADHDDAHESGQLVMAAIAYAAKAIDKDVRRVIGTETLVDPWPWDEEFDKRAKKTPRELLVDAAAMLVAEIERRERAAMRVAEIERRERAEKKR